MTLENVSVGLFEISTAIVALGVIGRFARRWIRRGVAVVHRAVEAWEVIAVQMQPNGGSSFRDVLGDIRTRMEIIEGTVFARLDHIEHDIEQLRDDRRAG